ncbi:glycosyltransferase [Celeribacter neptunius]|uniref:Cellulose synthase (UDP-forming) n=1 Tax=Celeribacter neptunius TaxID=588602 RepID=A0A1I3PL61_9RHOB|nr:glycosyltransferase [Celeribacter neptunius]SFJ22232.1 cellulose synthase (UDP-forming) [Celeribacter neptunius]
MKQALTHNGYLAPMLSPRQRRTYGVIAALWGLSALFFWGWWLRPDHVIGLAPYLTVTLVLAWIWGMQLYFVVIFFMAQRSAAPDPVSGQWRVAMITTKTPSEPFSVVRKTLEAMLAQDVAHDTWLADEDPSEATRDWCAAHGVKLSTRKGCDLYHQSEWPRRTRCKEGNLAYFYDHWGYRDYDIVSQLDSDHVPHAGYLREMLRPFADPDVGYVSAPSICAANADESWAARTRLYAEAAFHGVFQTGYAGALTPMCIGSHYAVRTSALKAAGGLGPELAEDHSTTMLLAAAGYKGVHAVDAIAVGDGPASLPDLVTQEFQWSRSLMTLLLRYTPDYLGKLPPRLKFLFLLAQSWYAFFAISMAVLYFVPITALLFDQRFADVHYPAFLGHVLPMVVIMILFAYRMKGDGFFRPLDAKVLAWEKALFVLIQWPWVLWGCLMAVRDRVMGGFVDFRITPKGEAASRALPAKIVALYGALAVGSILPVLTQGNVVETQGFYILALINGFAYTALLGLIVIRHLRDAWRAGALHQIWRQVPGYLTGFTAVMALGLWATSLHWDEGLYALSINSGPLQVTKVEYVVSGAGMGQPGEVRVSFEPKWRE